jgi:C1A family cysteine protease
VTTISGMKLPNDLYVNVTYDYESNSVHVCAIPEYEHIDFNSVVIEYKEFIKSRLYLHKNVKYFVSYSNSGEKVEFENNNASNIKVKYLKEYHEYYTNRIERLLKQDLDEF